MKEILLNKYAKKIERELHKEDSNVKSKGEFLHLPDGGFTFQHTVPSLNKRKKSASKIGGRNEAKTCT
ncbi:MAG TPA: hypothetical protein DIT25_03130 [Candidatus Moranbacteria bacterium]|nr:hypothetical protein [Candidatus Moranbacteria bacterium]